MDTLLYAARFALLMITLFGYMVAFWRFAKIRRAFCPAVALSTLTLLVFAGGMLDILVPACAAFALIGAALFVYFLAVPKERVMLRGFFSHSGILFFFVVTVAQALLFSNSTLGHYDDFSHWGTIVKDMFLSGSFPGDDSQVARIGLFVNYPPATACFIFYVNTLIGYTEGHAIVAQNVLTIAAASALFVGRNDNPKKVEGFVYAAIGLLSLFVVVNDNGLGQFQSLLVDTVMGLMVIAALLIILKEHDGMWRATLTSLPVVLVFSMVKDNGKVYFVLYAMLLMALAYRGGSGKTVEARTVSRLAPLLVPCVGLALISVAWKAYVDSAYSEGYFAGKFAVSPSMLGSLDYEYALSIPARVFYEAFCYDELRVLLFWGLNLAAIVGLVSFRARRKPAKTLRTCFIVANASIFLTCIALVVLYACMMPPEESENHLAGFSRYYGTSLLVFFCLQAWGLATQVFVNAGTKSVSGVKADVLAAAFVLALAAMLYPNLQSFARGVGGEHMKPGNIFSIQYNSGRSPISSVFSCASKIIPRGQTTAVYYGPDIAAGSYWYLSSYELQGFVTVLDGNLADNAEKLSEADWMVVVGSEGRTFLDALENEGVTIDGASDARIFRVCNEGGKVVLSQTGEC